MALVLEEIQVAQPLDLRVMHRVLARDPGGGEAAAKDKGHGNGELRFGRIKATPQLVDSRRLKRLQRRPAPALAPLNETLGAQKRQICGQYKEMPR